jgi:integrase
MTCQLRERVPDAQADGVAATIARWRPRSASAAAAEFARAVVAQAEPGTPERARSLLFAAVRLAAFGESVGLAPCAEALLRPALIERLIVEGEGAFAPATRRTLRTNLRALARAAGPALSPEPVPLPRERSKRPYREAEIAGYLRLAAAQPTPCGRMRAQALVCLGAGAGIVAGELRGLRGSDVIARSGGLVVCVAGRRARTVPVLWSFQAPLAEAAAFAGESQLIGGREPERKNLSDALGAALSGDGSLPRLEPGRLRATWLAACAELIGLRAFMQAAGIRCSQRLGDLVAWLPDIDEEQAVELLGGGGGRQGSACAP